MFKRFGIVLGVVGFGLCLCVGIFAFGYFKKKSKVKDSNYFKGVPITKWTKGDGPCVSIQIGNMTLSTELDLGFRGHCSIQSTLLDQIKEKKLIGLKRTYNLHGTPERKNAFELPNIRIGGQSFEYVIAHEEAQDFHAGVSYTKDGSTPSPAEPARIGWEIFENTPLLLDFKNQKIAFCDKLSTIEKEGYKIEQFVSTPLLLDRGLVEVECKADKGILRCVLDTGCTLNILNDANEENKSMQELLWNPENFYTSSSCQINDVEFGPITFRQVPIRLPIHIDAMLGMDFLSEHIVFLDFPNHAAYFSRYDN